MLGVTSSPGLSTIKVFSIVVSSSERRGMVETSARALRTSTRASAGMTGSPDSLTLEEG